MTEQKRKRLLSRSDWRWIMWVAIAYAIVILVMGSILGFAIEALIAYGAWIASTKVD